MTAIRTWMARRSGPELFFINALLWAALFGLLELAAGARVSVIALALSGALFGLFMTAITLSARKRAGGAEVMIAMNTAIRTGELPPFFNPTTWTQKLESRRAALQRSQISTPIFFGLVTFLLVVTAFLSLKIDWANFVLAALVAAMGAALTVTTRRRIPKIVELQQQISTMYPPADSVEPDN